MARPKKPNLESLVDGAVDTLAAAPAAETPKPQSAIQRLQEALAAAIAEDPDNAEIALRDILGVGEGNRRKVDERPRKVDVPKDAFKPRDVSAEPLPPPKPGVVYYAEAANHFQVLKRSIKKFYGDGNVEVIPGVIAQAENHIIRLEDPELIAIMDRKIQDQIRKYSRPLVVKLRDEIAEAVESAPIIAIPNPNKSVTVETPLADLVVT